MSVSTRLRERKLVQWSIAYLATGWVVLEAFGFVAERFGWPAGLVRGATILLGAGFFLVLILAWYHGEQGRQRAGALELALVGAVVVAGGGALWLYAPTSGTGPGSAVGGGPAAAAAAQATRFLVLLPENETLKGAEPALAVSPDGVRIAYAAGSGDSTRLYVRELTEFEGRPIPGTEGARAPFFSPDGEWVGFFADRAVKKISLSGGAPQTLVEDAWTARYEAILTGSWPTPDTMLLSFPGQTVSSTLWVVSASTGAAGPLAPHTWEHNHYQPQLLPDGEHILYSDYDGNGGETTLSVVSLRTGEERVVVERGGSGHYGRTGHLVYRRGGDLLAAPFDPEALAVTGPSVPVVENVLLSEYGTAQFALSESGTMVYVPGGVDRIERTLVWVDTAGVMDPIPGSRTDAYTPRISPAGDRVAFQRRPATDLWVLDLDRGAQGPIQIQPDTVPVFWHLWTPDGSGVVFNADFRGTGWTNLYEARIGSRVPPRPLTNARAHQQPQDWLSDGETLVYTEWRDSSTQVDIWRVPVPRDWTAEVDRTPRPVLRTPASEFHPAVSPDGEWLAYASDASGRWEVYAAPFDGVGPTVQVSTGGGSEPAWSPDGRTLYFRSLGSRNIARQMMAVALDPADRADGRRLRAGTPRVLFDGPYFQCSEWGRSYDLDPDGRRFLMVQDQRPDLAVTQINVVVNWFAELPAE